MLEKDVLHLFELFGKYGLTIEQVWQYSSNGIVQRVHGQPSYWKIIKPELLPKHNAIKSINNLLLFKSRDKFYVHYPNNSNPDCYDNKEGAIEFMKQYRKFKTTTGSGYTVKFNREEMIELYQHFGDSHNIGIAIRRLL